uniref:Uncharacterized protein n=1 Tax=viral metagenome TaxID=1070528 RepID=A0A6M3JCQ6_9ZZZZ
MDVSAIIDSMKGISGSGNVLSQSIKNLVDFIGTLDPGDAIMGADQFPSTAPIGYDLWYLWTHSNFLANYFAHSGTEGDHFNYTNYLAANLKALERLTGLRPLKILKNIPAPIAEGGDDWITHSAGEGYDTWKMQDEWFQNGVYWINTMAFELHPLDISNQYPSDGPKDFDPNISVGYVTFPIGQLGVMEVISLMQETGLSGNRFAAVDSLSTYWPKPALTDVPESDKPALQTPPELFPAMKDGRGNALAGQNYCYGRHLVEDAYRVVADGVELFSAAMGKYPEDVKPKFWMRYWIKQDDTFPVPGEFIGILVRPVAAPPHVWWFQESSPFLYAGHWMETWNLTSGVITEVILEAARTDSGVGNQYKVKIQGCEVIIDATDFLLYSVGDRVAVLKASSTAAAKTTSFRWLDQSVLKKTDEETVKTEYIIFPGTFYKLKT